MVKDGPDKWLLQGDVLNSQNKTLHFEPVLFKIDQSNQAWLAFHLVA